MCSITIKINSILGMYTDDIIYPAIYTPNISIFRFGKKHRKENDEGKCMEV